MARHLLGKTFAASLALAAGPFLAASAMPASAHQPVRHYGKQARIDAHHATIRRQAYRAGYHRGWRDGRVAAAGGPVVTERSAYVAPAVVRAYGGPFENGGLLGTGVLDGEGVLGTGVLSGRGALGVGILGF